MRREPGATPWLGAAIDVGSNSVHLLVARGVGNGLEQVLDESKLLGLGDVVDATGSIPPESRTELVSALVRYRDMARVAGAERIALIGTEPLRRARNAAAVQADVRREVGVTLHALSVEQEGALTYLGVKSGRQGDEPMVIVDIGGGSTEIVISEPGKQLTVVALPSGSARLANGFLGSDPPTDSDLDRLRRAAVELATDLPAPVGVSTPTQPRAVFVGGTATNLARLAPLDLAGLAHAYNILRSTPSEEVVSRFGINLRRARQLAAGAAIVEALLHHYGLDEAEVSQASLREGAIIACAALGDDWIARLPELVGVDINEAHE
jgi:exopolyphosphatase/pppGpp-phosphohydrolase